MSAPPEVRPGRAAWIVAPPLLGLLLLLVANMARGPEPRIDERVLRRTIVFELKTTFAASAQDKRFTEVRPQMGDLLLEALPIERLSREGRRFVALTLLLLARPEAALQTLAPDDPAHAWIEPLSRGVAPPSEVSLPDEARADPWLRARLDLLEAETTPDLPEADLNRARARVFALERAHAERLGGLVGLGLLALVVGSVFLFRLRQLLDRARQARVRVHVPVSPRLPTARALNLFLFWLAAHLGLSLLLPPLVSGATGGAASGALPVLFTYLLDALVGVALVARVAYGAHDGATQPVHLSDVLLPPAVMERHTWLWGLGGVGLALVLVVGASILRLFVPESDLVGNPGLEALLGLEGRGERLAFLGAVALVAPFFEEVLFRGFVYPQLRERLGTAAAVSASAALFALVHLSLGSFLPLFALGVVLALAFEATGNLTAPMLIHAIWNGATALAVFALV